MWWLQARPLGWTTQAVVSLWPLPGGVTLGLRLPNSGKGQREARLHRVKQVRACKVHRAAPGVF